MASHPDSPPGETDPHPDGFEPGMGGAGTDARADGESPNQPIEDVPPPDDQPMPDDDQPMPGNTDSPPDSPGTFGGTAGTGGVNKVQEGLDR